ncbi:MAG: hypothetical protein CMD31_09675 [Flavobacteriales bacterium]|nr:hypothetical protein [Flavobacteriales bacterium]|tara:strand:+ start:83026 stop:83781 length:756 start_codon:yes stop_codon:yes gene_type:complete
MIKKHIFIIGGQRCGTTYLYGVLDSHPEIELAKPVRPEPKFFLNEDSFKKGKEFYERKYFSSLLPTIKVIGEKGTSYVEYPIVAERIKSFYPEAKIIVILRNPVERAISNYFFSVENGLETRTIEEVFLTTKKAPILTKEISVSPFAYLERGIYSNYLPAFLNQFNNNLKVIFFEKLFSDSDIFEYIYKFVGVESSFISDKTNLKLNQSNLRQTVNVGIEIYEKLYQYYQPHNKKLEQLLGYNINWQHDKI